MKTLLTGTVAFLISIQLFAQKPPIKYGDVPLESLKMKFYDKDSSANAVVLGDYGVSTIEYSDDKGFSLVFERTMRIKILKKDGFKWADFEIPLYKDGSTDEKLTSLKAQTTNLENGKPVETKVKNESIFKTDENENLRLVKVTFPNVKEGSVLDISYSVNSEFFTNLQDWQFQYSIPVAVSEYRTHIPEWFHYDRYMQGYIMLALADKSSASKSIRSTDSNPLQYQENRDRWVALDVPAFNAEPYITTEKDYLSKINFELAFTKFPNAQVKTYMGSWEDINKTYSESTGFYGEITGNNFLKKTVDELLAGKTSDQEKIATLNNYVKDNFTFNGSIRKFPSLSLKKVIEQKKGTSAELNLLLASMLEKAGLQVNPVLISTRDHGFVREAVPVSTQFNGVVCVVNVGDKQMLLDATDRLLPTGVLPQRCLNGRGLVISKSGFSWVELKAPVRSRVFASGDFMVDTSGGVAGKLSIDHMGYSAQYTRSQYIGKGEDEYIKEFMAGKSWQINKKEINNVKSVSEPLKEQYEIMHDSHADVSGDIIYLNPFLLLREESNPFKAEKREYPVNFGSAMERSYVGKFKLPEGYVFDELPQSKVISLPGNAARYTFNVVTFGDQVSITSILQINRDIFTQDEYPNLREFYNQVVAKQSEQIVIKKKP